MVKPCAKFQTFFLSIYACFYTLTKRRNIFYVKYFLILKKYIIELLSLYFDNSCFMVILINFWNRRNIPSNRIIIVISNFFLCTSPRDLYKIFQICIRYFQSRAEDISVIVFYPISCGINSLILAKYLLCFFSKMQRNS